MKRLLAVLLLFSAVAAADRVDDVFAVWDADGDGVLTKMEITDEALFTKVDRDADGKITRTEVGIFLGVEKPPPSEKEKAEATRKAEAEAKAKAKAKAKVSVTEAAPAKRPVTLKERVEDFFKRFDRNKDGKIQASEFQSGDEMFKRFDRNKNGSLSRKEIQRYIDYTIKEAKKRPRRDNFFDLFDRNRDGKVTRREYDGPLPFFRSYDHDKNNAVTMEELNMGPRMDAQMMRNRPRVETDGPTQAPRMTMLDRYDKDGDGRLTLEELGGAESILSRLDRNGDGVLQASEAK